MVVLFGQWIVIAVVVVGGEGDGEEMEMRKGKRRRVYRALTVEAQQCSDITRTAVMTESGNHTNLL